MFLATIVMGILATSCSDDDSSVPVDENATIDIVINEVSYGTEKWIELFNNGSDTFDVSGLWLCLGPNTYVQLGNSPAAGASNLQPNSYVVYSYSNLSDSGGLGLYSSNEFTNSDAIIDFVQWGAAGSARESVAVAANQWTAGEFIASNVSDSNSIIYSGSGDGVSDWSETTTPTAGAANNLEAPSTTLTLNLNGLEALGDDYVYEGWIIVNGNPVSTGIFSSVTFPQSFTVDAAQLANATNFVLTIEPTVDPDPAPAATKLLIGDFADDTANVWIGPVAASGDFNDSWGKLFLRTPTDEIPGSANNGNDQYGIWFGTPGAPPTSGLNLPTLSEGWRYEGWVVVDGVGPITTGTFTSFTTADDTNQFSGTENNAGPPIPGEDFFNNAPDGFTFPLDVRGRTAVISIEPYPDNSPMPFLLKPLVGTAGQETAPITYDLTLNTDSFPVGTVTR